MKDFWESKWENKDTPWSFEGSNDCAAWALRQVQLPLASRVFVPLCGDSSAVRFFYEQGAEVVALEYVPEALTTLRRKYFSDLSFEITGRGSFRIFECERLKLLEGDIFALSKSDDREDARSVLTGAPPFHLIYDRAALVAIEPGLREKYAATLLPLLAPSGYLAVEFFSVGNYETPNPPFPIDYQAVRRLFAPLSIIAHSVRTNRTEDTAYANSNFTHYERHWLLLQRAS